jgi:hypothetical protein
MNPEIKADWVAELRSGKHQQAYGNLKDDQGAMCCLGVLAECAVRAGVIGSPRLLAEGCNYLYPFTDEDGAEDGREGILPPPVVKWAGLTNSEGFLPPGVLVADQKSLIGLNDTEHYTFSQIADVIEEHF